MTTTTFITFEGTSEIQPLIVSRAISGVHIESHRSERRPIPTRDGRAA